jgi:hypothetical protein
MAQRLQCAGRGGRRVTLSEERWQELTNGRRRALLKIPDIDAAICQAIADPNIGTFDAYERRCYYRRFDFPPPYHGLFLRVATHHPHGWINRVKKLLLEDMKGDVVDVDLVDAPLARERRWWPPDM